MKKNFVLISILLLSLFCSGQERFVNLYPGWKANSIHKNTDNVLLMCTDTVNYGYDNTPLFCEIQFDGQMINSYRYVNDTLESISIYSPQSYRVYDDYIMACGVYKETIKDYVVNPIVMYFNKEDYYLDSILDLKSLFDNESTTIRFMYVDDIIVDFFGETDLAGGQRSGTYFCRYNLFSGESTIVTYSKTSSCKMIPYSAIQTPDGGYIICCDQDITYALPKKYYGCILKVDSEGNEMWRYVIRGRTDIAPYFDFEAATYHPRIFDAPDGNYWVVWTDPEIATWNTMQSNPESSVRIAKLTDLGDTCTLTGERSLMAEFDNPELNWWIINDSFQENDGDIYLLIKNISGINSALAKIHSNGIGAWFRTYECYPDDDADANYTDLYGLTQTGDGGFMLSGAFRSTASTIFPDGMIASVVFKVDSCGCFEAEGCNDHCMDSYSEHYVYMQEASIYPNPAKDKITVGFEYEGSIDTEFEYRIYNIDGKQILNGKSKVCDLDIGTCNLSIDICDLPSGYYTIQFWGGGKIYTGKFVKE